MEKFKVQKDTKCNGLKPIIYVKIHEVIKILKIIIKHLLRVGNKLIILKTA